MSMETYNESKHSLDTAYLVVIFVNTDEVAVIPHNWLLSSGECMWPRYQTQMKTNKAVINKTQPDDTWKAYKIKIVSGSDNYVKAQEIARKAELTDTVETEYDEDNRPKRYHRRYRSSSSDDEYFPKKVLHESSTSTQKPKKLIFGQMDNISVNDTDSCSDVDGQKQKTPLQTVRRSPRKSCTSDVPKVSPRKTTKKSSPKKSPSKGKPTRDNAAGMMRWMAVISTDQQQILRELKAIRGMISARKVTEEEDIEFTSLPLTSDVELQLFEEDLKDKKKKKCVVDRFTHLGGSSLQDAVKRMLLHAMTPRYMSSFNWTGRMTHCSIKERKAFRSLILCEIITGVAVRAGYVGGATLKSVEMTVRNFLRTNIDLQAKSLKRRRAATEETPESQSQS